VGFEPAGPINSTRPSTRMLAVEEGHTILEAAPSHLRVATVLLVQTGARNLQRGLSLRWDQVDLVHGVLHLGGSVKTTDSAQPLPGAEAYCEKTGGTYGTSRVCTYVPGRVESKKFSRSVHCTKFVQLRCRIMP
jgi:hypothetical protein